MKYFQVVFFLFFFQFGFSQQDIFDIARKGTVEELNILLLSNEKAIDSINSRGFTPLLLACYRGNTSVAIAIMQKSQLLDHASPNGTALAATVMSEKIELATELLKNNANPNITDSNGVSPLMLAIQFQKIEFIELFIKYGASKTSIDKSGKSVFEYAVFSKNEPIINLLKN